MTAIKKTTKSSKSPAPATKAAAVAKLATTSNPAVTAAKPSPAIAAVKSAPLVTTITARFDTGFGNALYVRGTGGGLNWDTGIPMTCISSDEWQLTLRESTGPIAFKLLVNDVTWSTGSDFTAAPGDRVSLTPSF